MFSILHFNMLIVGLSLIDSGGGPYSKSPERYVSLKKALATCNQTASLSAYHSIASQMLTDTSSSAV